MCIYKFSYTYAHIHKYIYIYACRERKIYGGNMYRVTLVFIRWISVTGLPQKPGQEFGQSEIFRSPYVIPRGLFLCQIASPGIPSHAAPCKSHCRSFEHGTVHDTLRGEERGEKKKVLSWSYLTLASHLLWNNQFIFPVNETLQSHYPCVNYSFPHFGWLSLPVACKSKGTAYLAW